MRTYYCVETKPDFETDVVFNVESADVLASAVADAVTHANEPFQLGKEANLTRVMAEFVLFPKTDKRGTWVRIESDKGILNILYDGSETATVWLD